MGLYEYLWVVRMTVQHQLTGEQMEVVDPSRFYVTLGGSLLPREEWQPAFLHPLDRWDEWRRTAEGMPD